MERLTGMGLVVHEQCVITTRQCHKGHCATMLLHVALTARACRPVRVVPDPIRGSDSVLVLCMVMNPDSTPHESNERFKLMEQINDEIKEQECLFGFEQVPFNIPFSRVHLFVRRVEPATGG